MKYLRLEWKLGYDLAQREALMMRYDQATELGGMWVPEKELLWYQRFVE